MNWNKVRILLPTDLERLVVEKKKKTMNMIPSFKHSFDVKLT